MASSFFTPVFLSNEYHQRRLWLCIMGRLSEWTPATRIMFNPTKQWLLQQQKKIEWLTELSVDGQTDRQTDRPKMNGQSCSWTLLIRWLAMTAQHHQQEQQQQQQQQHYHPTYDCKVLKNNRHVVLIHLSITIYMKNSKNYVEANRQTDGRADGQTNQPTNKCNKLPWSQRSTGGRSYRLTVPSADELVHNESKKTKRNMEEKKATLNIIKQKTKQK